jgi:hypothetical protein
MRPCPLGLLILSRRLGMRETSGRSQLALQWADELRWDQLPASMRSELREVLRALLQRAAAGDGQAEAGDDE